MLVKRLKKTYFECMVQNKKCVLVKETYTKSLKEMKMLESLGFHAYVVKSNPIGTPIMLMPVSDSTSDIRHYGYIVFNEPIVFPKRKDDETKYYSFTNQNTKYISFDWMTDDIISVMKTK